jgi:hypothetical protein
VATPALTTDQAAIRSQLERLLESHGFRTSKRYPNLLRHLVERTLEGRTAELKERTLGVEVFGRPADYDTNADPVVRVSAGEIRKRIAQYYHEPGRETELRIDLPLGSYVPEFHTPVDKPAIAIAPLPVIVPPKRRSYLLLVPVVLCALAGLWWRPWVRPSAFEQFWRPVLNPANAVLLCVARSPGGTDVPADDRPRNVAWADVKAAVSLAGMLEASRQPYQLRLDVGATLADLRQAPAIMIGAFNDVWTLRMTSELRFTFQRDGKLCWIRDRQNPSSREWMVDLGNIDARGRPVVKRDYAVISRIMQALTGKVAITVAGIWGHGTEVAGEFVTDRSLMASLARHAPPNWEGKNIQIVLATEIIDGQPGPPRVVSTHFW